MIIFLNSGYESSWLRGYELVGYARGIYEG